MEGILEQNQQNEYTLNGYLLDWLTQYGSGSSTVTNIGDTKILVVAQYTRIEALAVSVWYWRPGEMLT